jgi:hypothetical protein
VGLCGVLPMPGAFRAAGVKLLVLNVKEGLRTTRTITTFHRHNKEIENRRLD